MVFDPALMGASLSDDPLGAMVGLEKSGTPRRNIRLSWWSIAIVSALSAAVGYAVVSSSSGKTGAYRSDETSQKTESIEWFMAG